MLTLNIIRNTDVIIPKSATSLVIDSLDKDFLEIISNMGYIDTINLLGPELTFNLFYLPIIQKKKLPKREIAKAITIKSQRVRKYDNEIFITRSRLIHGNSINYSNVISVNGSRHDIPLICNICDYMWNTAVHIILSGKGCPSCGGNLPWTLESFINTVKSIYDDRYDYDAVKEHHIQSNNSHIPITCKLCFHNWNPTIRQHIYDRTECPKCNNSLPLTYDKFIDAVVKIYGNDYDFSEIKESDITKGNCRVSVCCIICNMKWQPLARNLVYGYSKCPGCKSTLGEKACIRTLRSMNIIFEREIKIEALPTRYYDFRFIWNGARWILEYDGKQHFKFIPFFHNDDIETFHEHQNIDIIKTKLAIKEDYHVIRIDYTQINNIQYHIEQALRLHNSLYLSTPELYTYLY